MSDKEENIDKFIKKSLAFHEVEYNEAHWQAMEKRLDAEMPVGVGVPTASSVNIPSIILSVLGGMVLMLAILWMTGTFEENQETEHDNPLGNMTANLPLDADKPSDIHDKTPSKSVQVRGADQSLGFNELQQPSNVRLSSRNHPEDQQNNSSLYDDPLVPINEEASDDVFTRSSFIRNRSMLNVTPLPVYGDIAASMTPERLYPVDPLPVIHREEEAITVPKENLRLGVMLGFAPDFNGVGMPSGKSFSGQLGFQLFATYKERISISSGIYYGKKKYSTEGENYRPPTGYWNRFTNGVVPMEVIGTSVVVDVPVNITYHWNPDSRLQFISSVGVSSYYILSEDCWYKFETYNPGTAYGWDSEETEKELFGVGNISVGMLWDVSPRFSLRVEPYLKVPFKDFGWGRINLYGAGSLVSVQYVIN